MIHFNAIRDALDIGIRKEQQATGDDDSYWKLCLTHLPNDRIGRHKIG